MRNRPVDVISVCSADGEIRPLRLRMEDEEHKLRRIDIDQFRCVYKPEQPGFC